MLLNDLMKQFNESIDDTGPKFTGYWKGKDAGTPGKKMVGEEENPTDKVTMDIPLFLRMMEYAKEDAKTDMDLHDVTERAIALMKEHEYLCMDNYNDLVGGEATGGEQPTNEEKKGLYYYVNKRKKAGTSRDKDHPKAPSAQDWKNAAKTAKKESVEEFKDTVKYGDDSGKNINHEIFQLLKSGAKVYSNAAGRMGEILRANNDSVIIKTKRGKGSTSFNSGDAVKIKQDKSKPNTYYVVNVMDEGKKKGADGKACWDGYRYAGTEYGKDKCVPVKKGK